MMNSSRRSSEACMSSTPSLAPTTTLFSDDVIQVEVMLLWCWLGLIIIRRGCEAVTETVFFWVSTASREREDNEEIKVQFEQARVSSCGDSVARRESVESMWQQNFSNPEDWWDNRTKKTNLRQPDFKHIKTRKALWIDNYQTPEWVKERLGLEEK